MAKEEAPHVLTVPGHEVRVTHPCKVYFSREAVNAAADLSNALRKLEISLSELETGFKSGTGPDQEAWHHFQAEYRSWSDRIRAACPPDAVHGDAVAEMDAAIGHLARLHERPPAARGSGEK